MEKRVKKEAEKIKKQLYHQQAQRFSHAEDAQASTIKIAKKWKYHQLKTTDLTEHKSHKSIGRPKAGIKPTITKYQISATIEENETQIKLTKERDGHYIIGDNAKSLSNQAVINAYKEQHNVERGFRFLKDPLFFTSSLFIKTPSRIMGLLMVMLLSLLVYGIAERRLRANLKQQQKTLPNQIGMEIPRPTLRWIFQLLHGIHHLRIIMKDHVRCIIEGITDLKHKILRLFGESVEKIYQFSYD